MRELIKMLHHMLTLMERQTKALEKIAEAASPHPAKVAPIPSRRA